MYMPNISKNKEIKLAIEAFASEPGITNRQVADMIGVHKDTIRRWRKDPKFVDAIYDLYMVYYGSQIPCVLQAMIDQAKAGNVQAGRLVLEHSGKLVKNVNITIDSPFEKFLKADASPVEYVDAEIQDIVDDVPNVLDDVRPKPQYEKMESKEDVYLMQSGDTNFYKIGFSNDVRERMKAIQANNPEEINLVATCPGGYNVEQEIHKCFNSKRNVGEWFEFSPQDLDNVLQVFDDVRNSFYEAKRKEPKKKFKPKSEELRDIKKEIGKHKRSVARKKMYKLRKRAEAVGLEPLGKKPSALEKENWLKEIERRENDISGKE